MENVSEAEKKTLSQKLLEFQKEGLESYGNYLQDQLEMTAGSEIKRAYRKYIEDQIEMNNEKIRRIDEKL